MTDATAGISALASENRTFPPSESTKRDALVTGTWMYDEAAEDYQGFWAKQAGELLDWDTEWDTICEWELPYAKWFVGGKLNVAHNCLDRHVAAGRGDKVAIHFEGEPGDTRTITYADLLAEVQRFANVLKGLGVQAGDRVNIYLPMIPEAAVAMLACARIGAPHSVVFGGFSSQALADRINDAEAKVLITADGGWRRGSVFPLKPAADEAVANTSTIEHVVVVQRGENEVHDGRGSRPLVPRADGGRRRRLPGRAVRLRAPAVPALHVGHHRQAEGHHAHDGRLPDPGRVHPQVRVRPPSGDRRVLVHRRRRLGHRAQLHRLRPAGQRGDDGDVRGRPELPGQRPLLGDRREVRGDDLLHRPDGDPHDDEVGRRGAAEARPVEPAPPRLGRRADQPRGVDVVPHLHRRRALPDRRHVVADRDRRDHDQPAARRHDHQARLGDVPAAGHRRRGDRRQRRARRGRRRLPDADPAVAVDAARHLGRPRALPGDVLEPVPRPLLRRRRRQARRPTATSGCSAASTT